MLYRGSAAQYIHASLTTPEMEESIACRHCQQFAAVNFAHSPNNFVRLNHHPSIASFKLSSQRCPLCRQLLEWIDPKAITEFERLENSGGSTIIHVIEPVDERMSPGIRKWIFSLDTQAITRHRNIQDIMNSVLGRCTTKMGMHNRTSTYRIAPCIQQDSVGASVHIIAYSEGQYFKIPAVGGS